MQDRPTWPRSSERLDSECVSATTLPVTANFTSERALIAGHVAPIEGHVEDPESPAEFAH